MDREDAAMRDYGEAIEKLMELLPTFPGRIDGCLDSKFGDAIWPRDLDAILTAGPTAVEAVGFTITDRSEGGWTATFEGQHDYEDRMATLECRVNVGTLDGMPVIWARYHEKRDPKRVMSKEQALAILRYKRI